MPESYFFVTGIPKPQGSKKIVGKFLVDSTNINDWRNSVVYEAKRSLDEDLHTYREPISVSMTFYMPRPKSRKKDNYHATRPDLDKLIRAVLDGITNSGLITDDAIVARIEADKFYVDEVVPSPGVSIHITTLEDQ